MTDDNDFDRRSFLAVTGAVGAAGLLGLSAGASEGGLESGGVAIVEEGLSIADAIAEIEGVDLVRTFKGEDPVRVWRDRVEPLLADGGKVMGVTRWSEYLIYRDLARDSGRKLGFEIGPTSRYGVIPPQGDDERKRLERELGGPVHATLERGEIADGEAPVYAPSTYTTWRFV